MSGTILKYVRMFWQNINLEMFWKNVNVGMFGLNIKVRMFWQNVHMRIFGKTWMWECLGKILMAQNTIAELFAASAAATFFCCGNHCFCGEERTQGRGGEGGNCRAWRWFYCNHNLGEFADTRLWPAFPDHFKSFQTIWKVSISSGKFPDHTEVSRPSRKFPDRPERFQTIQKVLRPLGKF